MPTEYANLPMSPIGIPPEARAARPDTRALHVGPPAGVSDEACGTVEALVGSFSGAQAYGDYWRPDADQLAALNAGGFIELVQWTPRMVMHSMSVWDTSDATGNPSGSEWARGAWMQTYSGRQFYPLDPDPADVVDVDIAHALSMICRYGGHTSRFYSVAEHCVLLSRAVPPEDALWALLHDATEAYVGDMVRPLKHHMPAYREVEDRVMSVIALRFGLREENEQCPPMPAAVKDGDNRILLDERAALLGTRPADWAVEDLKPLGVDVQGWSPHKAELAYMERLLELTT